VSEYVPVPHIWQVVEPGASEYVPLAQSIQSCGAVLPGTVLYLPAAQASHVASETAARDHENLPATQLVHAADPLAPLYLPAAHPAHGPPLGPV